MVCSYCKAKISDYSYKCPKCGEKVIYVPKEPWIKKVKCVCSDCYYEEITDEDRILSECPKCQGKIELHKCSRQETITNQAESEKDSKKNKRDKQDKKSKNNIREKQTQKEDLSGTKKKKKWPFIIGGIIGFVSVIAITVAIVLIVGGSATGQTAYWPDSKLANLIPRPNSKVFSIENDDEYMFSIIVQKVSKRKYQKYVVKCKQFGFTEEMVEDETFYSADNAEGYSLSIYYDEEEKSMEVDVYSNGEYEEEPEETEQEEEIPVEDVTEGEMSEESVAEEEEAEPEDGTRRNPGEEEDGVSDNQTAETEAENNTEEAVEEELSAGYEERMTSLEEFFDQYGDFMQEYLMEDDPSVRSSEYDDWQNRYQTNMQALNNLGNSNLSESEKEDYMTRKEAIEEYIDIMTSTTQEVSSENDTSE